MAPSTTTIDERVERLSGISVKRVLEPDEAVPGHVGEGKIIPDELLTVAGLDLSLTEEQRNRLGREELASVLDVGIRFESALMAGFSFEILRRQDLTDPRVTYILHEIGEETRHSRLFVRTIGQLAPQATNPFARGNWLVHRVIRWAVTKPSLFCILVLTGEEIPDLFQKLLAEHPDTDPFVKAISRYHRQEEARHLSFARMLLPELWQAASRRERFVVHRVAPFLINGLFDTMIHPGVYATVGLPTWSTWRKANATPQRRALRHEALQPLVRAMTDAGALRPGHISKRWQRLAGIDRDGRAAGPVAAGARDSR